MMIATEAAMELTLPGYEGDFTASGNGVMGGKGKRVLGSITGVKTICKNEDKDFEYVCGIRDTMDTTAMTLTLIDGVTYAGSMGVQGEVKMSTDDGGATFELRGEKLEQI